MKLFTLSSAAIYSTATAQLDFNAFDNNVMADMESEFGAQFGTGNELPPSDDGVMMDLESEFAMQFGDEINSPIKNDETPHNFCWHSAVENGISSPKVLHSEHYFSCMLTQWKEMHEAQTGNTERALLKENMGLVNEYGCWCFFEEEFVGGSGPVQDPLDEICKTLSQGYSCIIMDEDENGTPCTPYEIVYNSAFGSGLAPFGLTMENLVAECENQNQGGTTCEIATCKVEGWFLLSYFTWTVFGGSMQDSMMAANGFDHDATCKGIASNSTTPGAASPINQILQNNNQVSSGAGTAVQPTIIPPSMECCGAYPVRFPYKHSDDKMCCEAVGVTYNTNLLECCPNNQVMVLGSC